jgi:aminodeoxyfutalosine synthase
MFHPSAISDPALRHIAEKILADTPLSHADGLALYASPDIHAIGRLANFFREKLHGHNTYYNCNRHINYTNLCVLACKFCSFYRKPGEHGAYQMSIQQIIATAKQAAHAGATEVHIVGGLHPTLKFHYYLDMLRGIKQHCPTLHIKAFTAIEIIHFSRIARLSIRDVLIALRQAGLGSLPGGGAEIFDDRLHDQLFKNKVRAHRWFDVHRTAHALGIYSNATMLYGHLESPADRISHLIKLRDLQAESLANMKSQIQNSTACFNCCVPLSFIPQNSELGYLPGPTGLTDLKTLAIARLILHNIPHIKAFWVMHGIPLAQLSLHWGVDDLDGTVVCYDITKRPGGDTHQELHLSELIRLIRQAGRIPVQRDTLYRQITRAT